MANRTCSIEDCDAPVKARGWCSRHYTRWYETGSLDLGVRPRGNFQPVTSLTTRFWAKVRKTDGCWIWTAGKTAGGYGQVWSGPGGRLVMAHRVAWELSRGKIPAGLQIDHLCRNTSCVNPDHLEPVSVAENTRRGYAPSIGAAYQKAKTHCPQGHPYDEGNTYIYGNRRVCKTCAITRSVERRGEGAK